MRNSNFCLFPFVFCLEFGAYFVESSRQTKQIHQTLEESLENVRTLRHLLLADPSLLPEEKSSE